MYWKDMFSTLCTIYADTSAMAGDLKPLTAPSGQTYYELAFDVVLLFGLTELKAQIRWMEKVLFSLYSVNCILRTFHGV